MEKYEQKKCLSYSEQLKCLRKDHIKYGLSMESNTQNYQSKNKDRHKIRKKTEKFILEENTSEKEESFPQMFQHYRKT